MRFVLGFCLSAVIAAIAWRRGSLSRSGAIAAVVVGTLVFGCGGPGSGALLIVFFVSSSALSRLTSWRKAQAAALFAKGSTRDAVQVLANGGIAAALALGQFVWPHPWWWPAFIGAIAAATADTWSTEVGTLGRRPPRLITTGRPVDAGTSGAVSLPGTLAALAGGALIGGLAGVLGDGLTFAQALLVGIAAGVFGCFADSLLGATVQGRFFCNSCRQAGEQRRHRCGRPARRLGGIAAIDNDAVNGLGCAFGAVAGVITAAMLV